MHQFFSSNSNAPTPKTVHHAALNGDLVTLEMLVKNDPSSLDRPDGLNRTPLICALVPELSNNGERQKRLMVFNFLWERTTNKAQADKEHSNVAFYAVRNGYTKAFEMIIDDAETTGNFALLDQLDKQGKNILMVAIENDQKEIVKKLSQLKPEVVKPLLEAHSHNPDRSIEDYLINCGNTDIMSIVNEMKGKVGFPSDAESARIRRSDSAPRFI